MRLTLRRSNLGKTATIGELTLDGAHIGYTVEPPVRHDVAKPRAIPLGVYKIEIEHSNRFDQYTPHLQDVPGFTFIEIHPGNSPKDTEGCILVGATIGPGLDFIGSSVVTFNELMARLMQSSQIDIEIL